MNKTDIINQTAQTTGQSKTKTAETINQAIATIQEAVSNGITVSLQSFISITPITRKACEGQIGDIHYSKPQRQGIKLRAMKPFKNLVETKGAEDEK